jgi:uncharacterized membrane protein
MAQDQTEIRSRARRWVFATLAMVGLGICAAALQASSWPRGALLAAALAVPLLLPLKGLIKGDRRTHAWATLCIAPCFVYGITEAIANNPVRAIAATILFASFAHFVALVAYLRVTRPGAGSQAGPRP